MNYTTVIGLLPALYAWLLLVWLLQFLVGRCGIAARGWARLLGCGLVALVVLLIPIDRLALARWMPALAANFSVPFAGMLAIAIWEGTTSRRFFSQQDWMVAWLFGLFSGLVLYPFALGVGPSDPYASGWRFSALFVAVGILCILLIAMRNRFGLLLLLSIAAQRLRLFESTNYWDYIVDPFYFLVSLPALAGVMVPRKMTVEFQRKVDSLVGPVICGALSFLDRLRSTPAPAPPVRKILVILLSEMGSLVLAHAMFTRLKERYPGASVHALVFTRHREILDLMGVIPKENVLTLDDRSLSGFAVGGLRLFFAMRRLQFDAVIDCELFARISSILSFLTGAPIRVGFHRHTQEGLYRGSYINRPVMYNPYRHLSQQFLTLAGAIESTSVPVSKDAISDIPGPPPLLVFPPEELSQSARQLYADFPAVEGKVLVLIYPSGGALPIRAWPMENYFELCRSLLGEGYAVGIIGMPADKALGQAIVAHCQDPRCIDLTGYTRSIRHLLSLFHITGLVITSDGGPGQFAALTPVPAIVMFGPETPVLYQPLARSIYCFHLSLPCSPCLTAYNHRTSPCDGDNRCLKQITPQQVLTKAHELLAAAKRASS